ncbi:MAG TPA: hypothetical protein VG797_02055 [Phycisphaerales bacterium]|nr:hypothetical protein [Phycisphaerales bacterium]
MLDSAWMWWILAGLGGCAGVWLLWSGLLGDLSRGRRRCRGCWYDMTGIPRGEALSADGRSERTAPAGALEGMAASHQGATEAGAGAGVGEGASARASTFGSPGAAGWKCPECGRVAGRERDLYRARRRWGRVRGGVLAVLFAIGVVYGEQIKRLGWVRALPNWALVTAFEWSDHAAITDEVRVRVWYRAMSKKQLHRLSNWCVGRLEQSSDAEEMIRAAKMIGQIEYGSSAWWRRDNRLLAASICGERGIVAIRDALRHSDPQVRIAAMGAIGSCGKDARIATPVLMGLLADPDTKCRGMAAGILNSPGLFIGGTRGRAMTGDFTDFFALVGATSTDRDAMISLFRANLDHKNSIAQAASVDALACLGDHDAATRDKYFQLLKSAPDNVVERAVWALMDGEHDERLAGALDELFADPRRAYLACEAVAHWGAGEERFVAPLGHVIRELRGKRIPVGIDRIGVYIRLGGDKDEARAVVTESLGALVTSKYLHDSFGLIAALEDIRDAERLGLVGPATRVLIESLRSDSDPAVRAMMKVHDALDTPDRTAATRLMLEALKLEAEKPTRAGLGPVLARNFFTELAESDRIDIAVLTEALATGEYDENIILNTLVAMRSKAEAALPELRRLRDRAGPQAGLGLTGAIDAIELSVRFGVKRVGGGDRE